MTIGTGVGASLGCAQESTFKTFATPTRWYEFDSESFTWTKGTKQGVGIRGGGRVARGTRRVVPTAEGDGTLTMDVPAKGLGLVLNNMLGAVTNTNVNVSPSANLQVHTLADLSGKSLTFQKGVPQTNGTVTAFTFLGCKGKSLEFSVAQGDLLKVKAEFDVADFTDAQAYTAPSYTAATNVFHFAEGAVTLGGTVTMPTSTTLATGGTVVANVREFTAGIDNQLVMDRYNLDGTGRKKEPLQGGPLPITGNLKAEFIDAVMYQAFVADTPLSLVLTFTGPIIGGSKAEVLQIVIPQIRFNGELPQVGGWDLPLLNLPFDGLDDGTNQPIYVCYQTADTAL